MSSVIYLDAVGAVETIGGFVKLELLSLLPRTEQGGSWQAEVCHRAVMHLRGFAELARSCKSLAADLESNGFGAARANAVPPHVVEVPRCLVPETLAEGVGAATVQAGLVRIELTRLEVDPVSLRDDLRPTVCLRLLMGPGPFFAMVERLEAELEQHGVRLMPPGSEPKTPARSPNFGAGA